MSPASVYVDVVSDVVCPWCYIGKRRLEAALAQLPGEVAASAVVRWHPFQLNPDLPAEGMDRRAYLEAKFGDAARTFDHVREAGRTVGIEFDFGRIARQPNTRDAHRLVSWAQDSGHDAAALMERLFAAYFIAGRFIGDVDELVAIAQEAGLDGAAARAHLGSSEGIDAIATADRRARELGITGVPFFIFNRRLALSGAQPAAVLADAITQSAGPGAAPAHG